MTSNQYEARYLEALTVLRSGGHSVADPYRSSEGARYVRIDGIPMTEEAVFEFAWGPLTAEKLKLHRPESLPDSASPGASSES